MSTIATPSSSPFAPFTPTFGRGPVIAVVAVAGLFVAGTVVASQLGTTPQTAEPLGKSVVAAGTIPGAVRSGAQAETHAFGPNAVGKEVASAGTIKDLAAVEAARGKALVDYAGSQYAAGNPAFGAVPVSGAMAEYLRQLQQRANQNAASQALSEDARRLNLQGSTRSVVAAGAMAQYLRQLQVQANQAAVADSLSEDVRRQHLLGAGDGEPRHGNGGVVLRRPGGH